MDKKEYRQIAEQSANGDAKAFAKLYGLIYREMYYTAFYTLKNDDEAISAVTQTARSGFGAIGNLHSEQQFRTYMMKTLCVQIKNIFKYYTDNSLDSSQPEIKKALFELPNLERMILAMNIAGKFSCDDIAAFAGMTKIGVKKRLEHAKLKLDIED
ncbi:MAG: hypothetical protein J1F03_02015 [Oscillospiraceae bacterium]|nr:hypothetical protein [Oscillospiraceae bacterium]